MCTKYNFIARTFDFVKKNHDVKMRNMSNLPSDYLRFQTHGHLKLLSIYFRLLLQIFPFMCTRYSVFLSVSCILLVINSLPHKCDCLLVLVSCILLILNILLQFTLSFLDECDKIKVLMHLHSFTYDYHLRCLHWFITDRQQLDLLRPGYHLTSFLDDFMKYYSCLLYTSRCV